MLRGGWGFYLETMHAFDKVCIVFFDFTRELHQKLKIYTIIVTLTNWGFFYV